MSEEQKKLLAEDAKTEALYEQMMERRNPDGYKLALRLMDAAAEQGATEEDFEFATDYVREWIIKEKRLHPITLAEVKRNRDAFFEKSKKG